MAVMAGRAPALQLTLQLQQQQQLPSGQAPGTRSLDMQWHLLSALLLPPAAADRDGQASAAGGRHAAGVWRTSTGRLWWRRRQGRPWQRAARPWRCVPPCARALLQCLDFPGLVACALAHCADPYHACGCLACHRGCCQQAHRLCVSCTCTSGHTWPAPLTPCPLPTVPAGRGGYGGGRGRGGYDSYGYESYGYEDYGSEAYGYEEGYEGYAYGGYGGYGGGGALVPMVMPNGQVAYMMTSTGAGATRRTGYGASTGGWWRPAALHCTALHCRVAGVSPADMCRWLLVRHALVVSSADDTMSLAPLC